MSEKSSLDILKEAILLERRGQAFYRTVADQASQPAVREFFETMAEEEARHIQILSDQFKSVRQNGRFSPRDLPETAAGVVADQVLSPALREKIAAADFEAAAISAAMGMEEKAIRLYAGRADTADDPEEASLFKWLADWERGHLKTLSEMDRALTEAIWNDNAFWPF
jgi:rubrerythrin